ncbi:hypothetical protein LL06_08775 [Hoeflea sp. BAL378]|uniref:hypothetical protein n=1 Tax=Hoeflea sp. BAL378 TaxID=1547437 RepID=UPI000513FB2D|nr:hypothetical protein [Hoeflea sp. BAL378]KGF69774.1 hypothetical protein LL06_08775 [Hoeflea sp. BAL378]
MSPDQHPDPIRREFEDNHLNGNVGSTLVSETDRLRVWHIALPPGERLPVHKHVLDYFWTALSEGKSRSHYMDGQVTEHEYAVGETKHFEFGRGEFMMHDLENIGDTELRFVTVEMKNGENEPLEVN